MQTQKEQQRSGTEREPLMTKRGMPKRRPPKFSGKPVVLFLSIMGSIFVAEAMVMVVLRHLPYLPYILEALLDAFLLSITLSPILYFLSLKPLLFNIRSRERTEVEREKALEFDRMKNGFITTAAHELLTPLSVVKGYIELLLSGERKFTENEQKEFLSIVYDKSEILERIVDDMLELSRIEAGQPLDLKLQHADIAPLIENIIDSYRNTFSRYQIEFASSGNAPRLLFDQARIGQVFRNILSNAVKYSPEGSTIRVVVRVRETNILIQVIDQGIGMTEEQKERMFDKFYRADASDTAKGGLGLGMAMAKVIVEGHGGSIWAESGGNKGTTVCFTLPRPGKS